MYLVRVINTDNTVLCEFYTLGPLDYEEEKRLFEAYNCCWIDIMEVQSVCKR